MRMVFGLDSGGIAEMVTTTESANASGRKTYHPQKKNVEHITDSFRCVALMIRDLDREESGDATQWGGWAGPQVSAGVGPEYRTDWSSNY